MMRNKVIFLLLGMALVIFLLAGCGTEREEEAAQKNNVNEIELSPFAAGLDYAEEIDDTIHMTILMRGTHGKISEDLRPDQITFAGDLKEAAKVEVIPSEEEYIDVEVSLVIPKGELTAENLDLDAEITLAAGVITDAEGNTNDEAITVDAELFMKNDSRAEGDPDILYCDYEFREAVLGWSGNPRFNGGHSLEHFYCQSTQSDYIDLCMEMFESQVKRNPNIGTLLMAISPEDENASKVASWFKETYPDKTLIMFSPGGRPNVPMEEYQKAWGFVEDGPVIYVNDYDAQYGPDYLRAVIFAYGPGGARR